MAKVSISEAARLAGRSRSTLYEQYIKKGKITVERDFEGRKQIDTSELLRVFGSIQLPDNQTDNGQDSSRQDRTPVPDSVNSVLQAENEALRSLLEVRDNEVQFLREQLSRTTALLTHQKDYQKPAKGRRWFWPFS